MKTFEEGCRDSFSEDSPLGPCLKTSPTSLGVSEPPLRSGRLPSIKLVALSKPKSSIKSMKGAKTASGKSTNLLAT